MKNLVKTYKKTYYIIMTKLTTKEKFIFGETTINYGDVGFLKFQLSYGNLNHKFDLLEKKYCKDNGYDPLTIEL
jgi:hypothetical protein